MLDKKLIWVIFLLEFKMGHKAVKTTCNINITYGPGTANDHSIVVWHLKQTGKEKSSISGCFMSWSQIKKIIIWKCRLLLFNATIIYQSDCDVQQTGNCQEAFNRRFPVCCFGSVMNPLFLINSSGIKRRGMPFRISRGWGIQASPSLVFQYGDKYPLPSYEP